MARPERVVLLAGGLLIGGAEWLVWTLLLLAVTSVFTSAQRIRDAALMLAHERVQERVAETPGAADAGARTAATPSERAAGANGHAAQSPRPATTQVSQVSPESPKNG